MRKTLVGIIVLFLIVGVNVYADSLSWIGKKVEGETTVKIDGKEIGAVIIDGKAFIPVRETAEVLGYKVNTDNGIELNNREIGVKVSQDGVPYLKFQDQDYETQVFQVEDIFQIGSNGVIILYPEGELRLTPENDLRLAPYAGDVYVPSWERFINRKTGMSLQDELDEIRKLLEQ